jgi:hypothetical protein
MKKLAIAIAMILSYATMICFSGAAPPEKQKFSIGPYHESVRKTGGECLLVCQYDITVEPHGIKELALEGLYQVRIRSVVIDALSGKLKRGDKIEFIRYGGDKESTEEWAKSRKGELRFVFRDNANGVVFIDPQNPRSTAEYSDETERILKAYFSKK